MPCAAAWAQPCAVPGSCRPGPLSLPCAFQVLGCLDLTKCGNSILEIMSRNLQSDCKERRRLALRCLVVLSKDPLMVRRGQRLKLRWGKQPLGLAGRQELKQLLPALLPHLPQCFGTGLWPVGPAAAGWGCSARAVLAVQPSMASQHSLVFHTGQTYTQPGSKPSGAAG